MMGLNGMVLVPLAGAMRSHVMVMICDMRYAICESYAYM